MKNSFDVFEFKEEGELPKFASHFSLGSGILSKEIATVMDVDAANVDCKRNTAGSFTPLDIEDLAYEHTSKLDYVRHNNFKSHNQAAEIKSNFVESGGVSFGVDRCSIPEGTTCLENHLDCVYPESSPNVESVRLASDAEESMSDRSSSAAADYASSDGLPSNNYFSGLDLGDDRVGIVFYPDFIVCRGTHYLDPVVIFSRSSVEVKSKNIYGNEGNFHVHLEIEDIVRIESQCCARNETGTISIYFIAKDAKQNEIGCSASVSGIQELRFAAADTNWYKKLEAIESLDMRYKALWDVLFDTGMEKCSTLHEGKVAMLPRNYFRNFEPFEEVIYPKGDPDAVSISKRDVDLLRPNTFVNDTIIDFYIKYLKTGLKAEKKIKFHFFNSFFFRKLADMDKDPSSAFDGNAAFHRVRKWTRKINMLEKDYIFIPVNYNYHWSLVVICYFGEVASYKDVEPERSVRVPCILHMDSIKGSHAGLKDLMQSYLWEEWKERQKETSEDLFLKFRNLKFVSLELPQQQNSYDCGLFLLHYVELFLDEIPDNFSIYKLTSSSKFLQADWFPPGEASMKRAHVERLIGRLLDNHSEDCSPSGGNDVHCSLEGPKTAHDYEGVEQSEKCRPLRGFHGTSLCSEVGGQGIEMTLLPASSIMDTQCTRSTGLVLKELFESGSTSESFNDAPWGGFERRNSLHEYKRPVSNMEEEVEASECLLVQTESTFQNHLEDGITEGTVAFPYSSPITSGSDSDDDVAEVEAVEKCQPIETIISIGVELEEDKQKKCMSSEDNMECSFVPASEELLNNASESQNPLVGISSPSQAKCSGFAKPDVSIPLLKVDSNDEDSPSSSSNEEKDVEADVDVDDDDDESGPQSDELHARKRMRIDAPESL
ncbi:hypothetical protein ACJIZ3_019189 [Penstemon smallii]|uniref:Ubiquitin-like protease family profile domain-containing protein n=1 Tax=Penstemon smallii TaxID=265156 RepID=A0ABD3T0G5_9LAMI